MKFPCKAAVAALIVLSSTPVLSADLESKTLIYVGTQGKVNAGVVTTNENHLSGTTKILGYTVDDVSAQPPGAFVEIFVGNTEGVNDGVVTPDTNHAGGSTRSIGYLSKNAVKGGTRLYVGEVGNCNAGVVTISTKHVGCATHFIGYALPQ